MASAHEPKEVTLDELEAEQAAALPDREALTTIDPVMPPLMPPGDLIMPAPPPLMPANVDSPIQETQ